MRWAVRRTGSETATGLGIAHWPPVSRRSSLPFVPVIGEFIAVPAAVIGVGLGLAGIRRFETGHAVRVVPAAVGTVLSVCAVLAVVVVLVATT